jgi:hypothetical protein
MRTRANATCYSAVEVGAQSLPGNALSAIERGFRLRELRHVVRRQLVILVRGLVQEHGHRLALGQVDVLSDDHAVLDLC